MKGQRDTKGLLLIKRGKKSGYEAVKCVQGIHDYCRDSCPMFGEPTQDEIGGIFHNYFEYHDTIPGKTVTLIKICQNKTLIFDEFDDER